MTLWLAIILAAVAALAGALLLRRGVRLGRVAARLNALEPTRVADDVGDIQLVRGRLGGAPLLASPYQGRPCLYYFFRVQDLVKDRTRTLASGKQWTLATITDASGTADVEGVTAIVASPRRFEVSHAGLKKIPAELAAFFEKAGIDEKHLPRLPKFTVHEYTLEPGDEVYVTGAVAVDDGRKTFRRRDRVPLIVSAEPDLGYVASLRRELIIYMGTPPLLFVAAVALFILGL